MEKTILELSNAKAKAYFLESENYSTFSFPIYINFKEVLDYVATVVDQKNLYDILKEKNNFPSKFEGVNHLILIKKDGKYAYRPVQLTNPYLYYLLVTQITKKQNWKEIIKIFASFSFPQIEVGSIPKIKKENDKSHKSASVISWWEHIEQRSIEFALKYRYMFVTDISNCYGSIYTHTIAWAIHGKVQAKMKMRNKSLLGNIIDYHIQGMQFGQTNGIPQGSTLFDFIAEIILGYADKELHKKLDAEVILDYKILRYRDDYRIFCNSKEQLERIAFLLQEVLSDLNMQLNTSKTFISEDVITDSIKKDKLCYLTNIPLYKKHNKNISSAMSCLQQEALYIHQFAKKHPNSGTITKLLYSFAYQLEKKFVQCNDYIVLISIFTNIALKSPKSYGIILMLISKLVQKIPSTVERVNVINEIYNKFKILPNIGELQIWMQRITYKLPVPIPFSESICKIVANEPNVELWNNAWVADIYKEDFLQSKICTNWLRDRYTPIIDLEEIALFKEY